MKAVKPRSLYYSQKLIDDRRLKLADRVILGFISSWEKCFASNDYIATFLGCSKSTVSRSIKKAKRLGYIQKNQVFEKNGIKTYLRVVIPELKKPIYIKRKYKYVPKIHKPKSKDWMRTECPDESF